jgi:hypothetical protein
MIAAQLGASRDNATQKVTELSFHKPFFVKGLFALVPAPIDRGIAPALKTMKKKITCDFLFGGEGSRCRCPL